MPQTVRVENLPGLVQDANKPAPDYITDLSGRRWPLASIDAAYAMADVTCESLALTNRYMAIVRDPAYAYADDYMRNKVRVAFTQIQCIQSRNLVILTMLFRYYSLRTGFQTSLMKANNWRLDRIVAPDVNGVATNFACNDYEDWLAVAKNLAADVLRTTRTNESILLGLSSTGTMQGMGVAAAVAPVLLATTEAGTAVAATTGAAAAAEAAGSAVVAVGGTALSGLAAALTWPVVGIVGCIVLGSVTAYGLKLGAAAWQEHDAADIALKKQDADAYLAAVKQRAEAKTDAERKAADELIAILDARRDKDAEQSGGLSNLLFGGKGLDLQTIAYAALGMVGIYMGLQLFLQNRSKSSASAEA